MNSDVAALYIESLNEMFRIHNLRIAIGLQLKLPNEIWIVLYTLTILSMIAIGYHAGIAGSKRTMAIPILAISFSVVFTLVAALDRPNSGGIKVTQQPLIDLNNWMNKQ
jgi:hypothetical protein